MLLQTCAINLLVLFAVSSVAHVLLPRTDLQPQAETIEAENATSLDNLNLEHKLLRRSKRNGPCTGAGGTPGVCIATKSCTDKGGKVGRDTHHSTRLSSI
jgi:hypothetical protein